MAFLQTFPNFNLYSMPLLILIGQGYLFAVILFVRYFQKRKTSDLLLALLLVITGLRCVAYTIGFMGWYDVYQNTKINYFLFDYSLILGPLVYFYVKSITNPDFKFRRKDLWHTAPWLLYVGLQMFIYIYDVQQPGFDEVQNGILYVKINFSIGIYMVILGIISRIAYFFFAVKIFYEFRDKIKQFFSNTYKVELNWLRNFLVVYLALFVLRILFTFTNQFFYQLTWTQNWWWYFLASIVVVYLGMMGIFADLGKLSELRFVEPGPEPEDQKSLGQEILPIKEKLEDYMDEEKVFLNPDLTLSELSKLIEVPSNQLSKVINSGFGKNFNDFVNEYRVEEVKGALSDPQYAHFSILGIAFECGFNSKATFNRVFKKFTGHSPSEYQMIENR
ncbi:MAG: helix-turn-helix domain-containing protein [Balneolaceae bacterium]